MTLAELKQALRWSHRKAAVMAGAEPSGMEAAIDALPDMRRFMELERVPHDLVEWIDAQVKSCSDYLGIQ